MRPSSFRTLLRINARGRVYRHLMVGAGLAIGMLALGLATVGGVGISRSFGRHLKSLFPEQRIVLRPKSLSVIWVQVETARITPQTLEAVRHLPGIRRVSPEATIRFPISAAGQLLGNNLQTDITVTGVEPWAIGDDVPAAFSHYDPHTTKELPAILSAYFLDLYNTALAESNNLPKFTPAAIVGRDFNLILGESTLRNVDSQTNVNGANPGVRAVPCRIAGLSRNPDLLGLLIPLAAVEGFNALYGHEERLYRALHAEIESPEALDAIQKDLERLGLTVQDRMGPWRRILLGIEIGSAAFMFLGALVFILAIAYMLSSLALLLSERGRDIALFQALGATPHQITVLLLSEIALTAAIGIGFGLAISAAAATGAGHWYTAWRASHASLPETLFAIPWTWIALLGLGCWLIVLVAALGRIAIAVRRPIFAPLAKER